MAEVYGLKKEKNIKIALAILAVIGIILLYWLLFSEITSDDIAQFVSGCGPWAPFLYIGMFVVLPAFFFPVAVLALAGGLLFGLGLGSLYTFLGALLNCALMFYISRYIGRQPIEAYVRRKLSPKWQARLAQAGGRQGFLLLIILRLIPAMPYNLINYGFGLTNMPFWTYMLGSAVGIIPGTLVFINIGDKSLDVSSPAFWLSLGLLVGLLLVTTLLGKRLFPETLSKNGEDLQNGTKKTNA